MLIGIDESSPFSLPPSPPSPPYPIPSSSSPLNPHLAGFFAHSGSEAQQGELFRAVILPNIGRQAEEIAALTPPEGDEGTIEDLTDTLSSEVEEAEEESGAPSDDTLKGATEKAKAYGFKTCGS